MLCMWYTAGEAVGQSVAESRVGLCLTVAFPGILASYLCQPRVGLVQKEGLWCVIMVVHKAWSTCGRDSGGAPDVASVE